MKTLMDSLKEKYSDQQIEEMMQRAVDTSTAIENEECDHIWGNFSLHCKTCQKCGNVEAISES